MANPEDLGRYKLKRLLGRGAMGEVWEANDTEQEGSKVAVKIMHAAEDELAAARSHFAHEALLASQLRHPHVVAVHDAGEAAGTSFLVMDMVEGRSLRSYFGDESVDVEEKVRWIQQIGDGLRAMHEAGLVHRDLKPENVIIRSDRSACLVDLGIAKWAKFDLGLHHDPDRPPMLDSDEDAPRTTYAPPETTETQLYDELGDQYAWGLLAYELLTGQVPKEDSPRLSARQDIPAGVAATLDRARLMNRDERWKSMDEALRALAKAASGGVPSIKPSEAVSKASVSADDPSSGLPPNLVVGAIIVGLLILGGVMISLC